MDNTSNGRRVEQSSLTEAILAKHGLSIDAANFLYTSTRKGIPLDQLLNSPQQSASAIGIEVTDDLAKQLSRLRDNQDSDDVDKEIYNFANEVIVDGQFYDSWVLQPSEVAKKLNFPISDNALDRLSKSTRIDLRGLVSPGTDPDTLPPGLDPTIIKTSPDGTLPPGVDPRIAHPGVAIAIVVIIILYPSDVASKIEDLSDNPKF